MIASDGLHALGPGKLAAIVTSLEMRGPPARRPDPAEIPWRLRPERRPDPDWFRDLFRRVGSDYLWCSRLRLSDLALRAILHDPLVEVFALERGGRDEGLLELDFRKPDAGELSFFGVTAPLIGSGAARWMMNRALDRAWARPIARFWVHTCSLDHPSALAFYERSGFRAFRRDIEVFDDPRATGALPRDAAPRIPLL